MAANATTVARMAISLVTAPRSRRVVRRFATSASSRDTSSRLAPMSPTKTIPTLDKNQWYYHTVMISPDQQHFENSLTESHACLFMDCSRRRGGLEESPSQGSLRLKDSHISLCTNSKIPPFSLSVGFRYKQSHWHLNKGHISAREENVLRFRS